MSSSFESYVEMEVDIVRPLLIGAYTVLLDKMVMKEKNMSKTMWLAGSATVGAGIGNALSKIIPAPSVNLPILGDGRAMEERIIELTLTGGSAYTINKYVFKNDTNKADFGKKMLLVAGADVLGSWTSDFLTGKPLTIF